MLSTEVEGGACVCGCDSQGPELGHVVEAGNWDAADVVVV